MSAPTRRTPGLHPPASDKVSTTSTDRLKDTRPDLDAMFESMVGRQVDGGCSECRAYQELEQIKPGIWTVIISHDNGCKFFAKVERARQLKAGGRSGLGALRRSAPSADGGAP